MKLRIWLFILKNFFKNKKHTKKKGGIFYNSYNKLFEDGGGW